MRNGKVAKVFCGAALVAVTAVVVSMFMLFVQTISATPMFDVVASAGCGSTSVPDYVIFAGLAGTLVFGLLAFLADPRKNDSDSV